APLPAPLVPMQARCRKHPLPYPLPPRSRQLAPEPARELDVTRSAQQVRPVPPLDPLQMRRQLPARAPGQHRDAVPRTLPPPYHDLAPPEIHILHPPHPRDVRLLRVPAVMPQPDRPAHQREQLRPRPLRHHLPYPPPRPPYPSGLRAQHHSSAPPARYVSRLPPPASRPHTPVLPNPPPPRALGGSSATSS